MSDRTEAIDDIEDIKADLRRIGEAEGDVLCRAALKVIEELEAERANLRDALAYYADDETPEGWTAIVALRITERAND